MITKEDQVGATISVHYASYKLKRYGLCSMKSTVVYFKNSVAYQWRIDM